MLVIFNLWAIPVLVIAFAAFRFAVWLGAPANGWTIGLVTLTIGGFSEFLGARGRLFFMPVWLIGVAMIAYKVGRVGTITFIVVALALMIWHARRSKKQEKARWEKIRATPPTPPPPHSPDETAFWQWVDANLFLPTFLDYTPEVCAHSLGIIKAVRASGVPLDAKELNLIREQQDFLTQARIAPTPLSSPARLPFKLRGLISRRLQDAPDQAKSKPAPAAPPPLPDNPPPAPVVYRTTADLDLAWGGFYASRESETAEFRVFRLLDFVNDAYHATLYKEKFSALPNAAEIATLTPLILHVPMSASDLISQPVHLCGSEPLTPAALAGYLIYLEQHDVSEADRASLQAKLISLSHDAPLRLTLTVDEGGNLEVTTRA